jgi:hypothetical protein
MIARIAQLAGSPRTSQLRAMQGAPVIDHRPGRWARGRAGAQRAFRPIVEIAGQAPQRRRGSSTLPHPGAEFHTSTALALAANFERHSGAWRRRAPDCERT